MKWKPYFLVVALQPEGKIKKGVVPTVTLVVESPEKHNQLNLRRGNEREPQLEYTLILCILRLAKIIITIT